MVIHIEVFVKHPSFTYSLKAELSKHRKARDIKRAKILGIDYNDIAQTKDERSLSSTPNRESVKMESDNDASSCNTPTPTASTKILEKEKDSAFTDTKLKVCGFFVFVFLFFF